MKPTPNIVSPAEWLAARQKHLQREKELTELRDVISAERRELPWVRLDKPYLFEGPDGPESLADLFAGRSQLITYHFMFGPGWEEGCPSCSFLMDHVDGMLPHLKARDTTVIAVSRAPYQELATFQQRMGWKFKWVSAHANAFNNDFHVSFTPQEMEEGKVYYNFQPVPAGPMPVEETPGISVFTRTDEGVFHTYSAYARGCDLLLGTYNWLDLTPKGRDEDELSFGMAWLRHHDRYDASYRLDPQASYQPPKGSICRK